MKIKIFAKGMDLLCTANIQMAHVIMLNARGKFFEFEGQNAMYWEDFSAYVEEAFA